MATPPLSAEICAETIAAWEAAGRNQVQAAAALGIPRATFQSRLRIARAREEGDLGFGPGGIGAGPERDGLDPFTVKGVSTYFNADGEQRGQWVKTKVDDARRLQLITDAIEQRAARITPLPTIPWSDLSVPSHDRLLNLLTMTDCHIGALAWHREGGEDFDLPIAREMLTRTFVGMLRSMPPARTCVINQLGDFLHTDGLRPVTPAHGNVLDADTRYQKMASVGADVLEAIILEAARLHERVHVILAEGNHDESGSTWLRIMFRRLFRDNPRVTIDDSPLPYYAYQHGKTMLGFHHGHLRKDAELPTLFSGEPRFRGMWGATDKTYIHTGHRHSHEVVTIGGAKVERHPTLAARDAFAARGGYLSWREAFGITYDADRGEVGRIVATPDTYRA